MSNIEIMEQPSAKEDAVTRIEKIMLTWFGHVVCVKVDLLSRFLSRV